MKRRDFILTSALGMAGVAVGVRAVPDGSFVPCRWLEGDVEAGCTYPGSLIGPCGVPCRAPTDVMRACTGSVEQMICDEFSKQAVKDWAEIEASFLRPCPHIGDSPTGPLVVPLDVDQSKVRIA